MPLFVRPYSGWIEGDSEPGVNTIRGGFSLAVAMSMLQRATANGDLNLIQQLLGVSEISEEAFYTAVNSIDLDLESRSNEDLNCALPISCMLNRALHLKPTLWT